MKKYLIALAAILVLPFSLLAQDEEATDYNMVELTYMMPKDGHFQDFEEAVKAHNEEFHPEGKFDSELYLIITGKDAGWYVWTMGPCTFTDLDSRPGDEAHDTDWKDNVVPHIHKYGTTEYWRRNDKVSNVDEESEKMLELWWMDITRGEYYRFTEFMKKIAPVVKERGDDFALYNNMFTQNDGRDVAIVFGFNKWADLDEDNPIKPPYEKIHGEGSWNDAMDEWDDFMTGNVREVWRLVE